MTLSGKRHHRRQAEDYNEAPVIYTEATLPHNLRVETGSGKIGAVGKMEKIQVHRQHEGERKILFTSSKRKARPLMRKDLQRDAASGDQKSDVERVLQDLSLGC